MKSKLIALDLDGVVFDFLGQFIKVHNLKNNTRVTSADITSFMPDKSLKALITEDDWATTFQYFEEAGGYATLKAFEGARTALENIITAKHRIIYITSRHPNFKSSTQLAFILNKIPNFDVYFCPEGKSRVLKKLQPDIFVDDNIFNCKDAEREGIKKVYIMDAAYNRGINTYERIYNLMQLEREVLREGTKKFPSRKKKH
jgi:5'(3')-deoxyribonucleotidase